MDTWGTSSRGYVYGRVCATWHNGFINRDVPSESCIYMSAVQMVVVGEDAQRDEALWRHEELRLERVAPQRLHLEPLAALLACALQVGEQARDGAARLSPRDSNAWLGLSALVAPGPAALGRPHRRLRARHSARGKSPPRRR